MRTGKIVISVVLGFLLVIGAGSSLLLGHASKVEAASQVELVTSKAQYRVGETVTFWLVNNGPGDVELPSARPWRIEGPCGYRFAPRDPGRVRIPLAAGETSLKWTWKANVLPGKYVVVVSTSVGDASAGFQIVR